ncbi:MAG: globin family protein [Cyanobacteria bacterium J06643_13]
MSLKVEVLEESFELIKPSANEFVASFYENLFTANPEAKPLFEHTDMAAQKKMLLNSLVMVVENLRKPDVLDKSLRGLGARHVKYGALPAHYPLVGGALLTTFEQYLQAKWTPEVKQSWVDAYGAISEIMLDGADYSEAEIALPTPGTPEAALKNTPSDEAEAGLQVELLESSFEEIKPQANEFVGSFYENLFTANPEAKPLFEHTDMAAQKKMLLNSLVMVVENLRKPDVLDKALRGLGARHVKYGALPAHYPLVGSALLTTFGQYLGDKWTPNVKEAWVGAYGAISEIMLDGADYAQSEVALKPESSNTEIAPPQTQSVNNLDLNSDNSSSPATVATSSESIGEFAHDSGKATIAAFAGGGILGVIATILVMLV